MLYIVACYYRYGTDNCTFNICSPDQALHANTVLAPLFLESQWASLVRVEEILFFDSVSLVALGIVSCDGFDDDCDRKLQPELSQS